MHHPILAVFYQCCTVLWFFQRKTHRVPGISKSLKSASENRQVPNISKTAEPKEFQVFSNPSKNHRFSWFRNPLVLYRFFPGSVTLNNFLRQVPVVGAMENWFVGLDSRSARGYTEWDLHVIYTYISVLKTGKEPVLSERTTQHSFLLQSKTGTLTNLVDKELDQFGWY